MADFIPTYDLESLNEHQRQEYIKNVCKHMGVPDNLNLVALTYVDDGEGPARLVAYAKRGATENVRNNLQLDIESLSHEMVGGSIVFTATAKSKVTGRREISTGSKWIANLEGTALDDAIMTAQTRALRRVTLQFIGAGVLDESEVNARKVIHVVSAPVIPTPQPVVSPSTGPGKDITEPKPDVEYRVEVPSLPATVTLPAHSGDTIKVVSREEAIAKLNAEVPVEEPKVKKTRKPRKAKVDLGPSAPVPTAAVTAPQVATPEPAQPPAAPATVVPTAPPPASSAPLPPVQKKPKLSAELSKPFRQRYFSLLQDYLEPAGFAPREGLGNTAKMRSLAQIMFPDVSDMNDLTSEQWEKYLSILENKNRTEGPAETIKYIEETIGI